MALRTCSDSFTGPSKRLKFVKTDSQWFMDHQQGGSNFTLRHFFDIFIQERDICQKTLNHD